MIMSVNSLQYSLPSSIQRIFDENAAAWQQNNGTSRIWAKDATLWTGSDEAKWLGWLDIAERIAADAARYAALRADVESSGFTDVLLMGMGGSSLCPEVLGVTFGKTRFHILDSTSPAQIKAVEDRLDPAKTLFIVASKSGSTLEPNCFKQYFFDRVSTIVGKENAGRQFVAVTDPGSSMEKAAKADGFRHIFYGDPEIGGRFSALSAFGMTAAAAMGIDVAKFLSNTAPMTAACRAESLAENPGALLGVILGTCHTLGRDKLTFFPSPEIYDLGAWLEQLIAESTGKRGVAIIPVDREPGQKEYGSDRVFAFISVNNDDAIKAQFTAVTAAGHPAVLIDMDDISTLGQEFFRWEFATATAGSLMKINTFDQPDVEAAKVEARKLTDEYEKEGKLPDETPFFESEGVKMFASKEYGGELAAAVTEPTLASLVAAHIDKIGANDYFALLAFIEMNASHEAILQAIRQKVLRETRAATCLGFGPRFLHSTGQAYKGGPNTGVFLQITADDPIDLTVPGQKYTFGVVRAAQARGDLQVLIDRGRRALRIHLGKDVSGGLRKIESII